MIDKQGVEHKHHKSVCEMLHVLEGTRIDVLELLDRLVHRLCCN